MDEYRQRKSIINPHYYGDIVRRLFLAAGIIIAFSIPLFSHLIPVPPIFSLSLVVALIFLAGYTSPAKGRVVALDVVSSAAAIVIFGSHAFSVWSSNHKDWHSALFLSVLAGLLLIFIFALYYSVKSLRGITPNRTPQKL